MQLSPSLIPVSFSIRRLKPLDPDTAHVDPPNLIFSAKPHFANFPNLPLQKNSSWSTFDELTCVGVLNLGPEWKPGERWLMDLNRYNPNNAQNYLVKRPIPDNIGCTIAPRAT